MSSFQDKINALKPLYSPTTVEDFRNETNKIVEILKEFPQLASPEDVDNLQKILFEEYKRYTTVLSGGHASTKYTEDEIINFGDAKTINTQIGYRYGVFNKPRWSFTNAESTTFSVIWVESNTSWLLETRGDTSKFSLNPLKGTGNKLIVLIYNPTKNFSSEEINKILAKGVLRSNAILLSNEVNALSDDVVMVLNKHVITLSKSVNSDKLIITFEDQKYTVFTVAEPEEGGTVTGGGVYDSGTQIEVKATANSGYVFTQWSDGNTQNPRSVIVTANITYTAEFSRTFTLTVNSSPKEGGTTKGSGVYKENETVTISATANSGYRFSKWSDGSLSNPRSVVVTGNQTYTAEFDRYYVVTVKANPSTSGTVSGGGSFKANTTTIISATPNAGFRFDKWNDESVENPRSITVTEDVTYTANFVVKEPEKYTISTGVNPAGSGSVSGGGIYEENTQATLVATPATGYEFESWSDGNTTNPRTITVTSDAIYTANFKLKQFNLTTNVNPSGAGKVSGGGRYDYGSRITLTAIPEDNYLFTLWNDGITENPREVLVTEDVVYTAHFEEKSPEKYTITTLVNPIGAGEVTGGGVFIKDSTTILTATPNSNYLFTNWDDGNTQNPRTITVTEDRTYVADFNKKISDRFIISAVSEPEGYGIVTGGGIYLKGTVITLNAKPASLNYIFDGWYLNGEKISDDLSLKVTVSQDATYAARFHYESKFYIILRDQLIKFLM